MSGLQRLLLVLGVVMGSCCGYLRTAAAQGSGSSCVTAFEEGQRQQLKGELERAAEQFTLCAASGCPSRVQAECQRFLETARSPIPGVLFAPVDSGSQRPLDGVSLSIDGRESRLFDGRMVRIEPGEHQIAFQRPGYVAIRMRLTLRADEPPRLIPLRFTSVPSGAPAKGLRAKVGTTPTPGEDLPRPVASVDSDRIDCAPPSEERPLSAQPQPQPRPAAALAATPRAPTPKRETSAPIGALVGRRRTAVVAAGVVGGLGAVGFAYFGLSARSADAALDACTPNCEPSDVDAIRRDYLLANVSLGVGLAGVVTASVLWLTSPAAHSPARAGVVSPTRWAIGVGPITTLATTF